jgi:hypothetical protein
MNYIKNKYYLILPNKKFKIIDKNNNKSELFKNANKKLNKKKLTENTDFVLLILEKNKNKNSLAKTGPVKINILFFKTSKRGAIKIDKKDKRNNLLFYTEDYLKKNKISSKDLKKVAKAAFNNKLEKRLFAPKLINQIKNIKL